VMAPDGSNVRQLTSTGFHTQPRWSPKGDTIVYTQREGTNDLWAVSRDGSNPRRLTAGPGDNEGAAWAPNGRHLAFQSNRLGRWQVFAMLLDGSPPVEGAAWAPNGRHLAFQSNRLGRWQVFAMLLDGSPPAQISQGPAEHTSPSWSPRLP